MSIAFCIYNFGKAVDLLCSRIGEAQDTCQNFETGGIASSPPPPILAGIKVKYTASRALGLLLSPLDFKTFLRPWSCTFTYLRRRAKCFLKNQFLIFFISIFKAYIKNVSKGQFQNVFLVSSFGPDKKPTEFI